MMNKTKKRQNIPIDMIEERQMKMCNWCFSEMVGVPYNPKKSEYKYYKPIKKMNMITTFEELKQMIKTKKILDETFLDIHNKTNTKLIKVGQSNKIKCRMIVDNKVTFSTSKNFHIEENKDNKILNRVAVLYADKKRNYTITNESTVYDSLNEPVIELSKYWNLITYDNCKELLSILFKLSNKKSFYYNKEIFEKIDYMIQTEQIYKVKDFTNFSQLIHRIEEILKENNLHYKVKDKYLKCLSNLTSLTIMDNIKNTLTDELQNVVITFEKNLKTYNQLFTVLFKFILRGNIQYSSLNNNETKEDVTSTKKLIKTFDNFIIDLDKNVEIISIVTLPAIMRSICKTETTLFVTIDNHESVILNKLKKLDKKKEAKKYIRYSNYEDNLTSLLANADLLR